MKNMNSRAAFVAAMCGLASVSVAGPDWIEDADAGSRINSAQVPAGIGDITTISGNLGGRGASPDFADMYVIGVDDPGTFRLELSSADFNAQLFIFNITLSGGALGLLANDDEALELMNPVLTSMSTDGSNAVLDLPGDYLIAVSGFGHNPISASGQIFDIADPTEISGADGPGGLLRHTGWEGIGETGSYSIGMEGTVFPTIPGPGVLAGLGLGLLAAGSRRRAG